MGQILVLKSLVREEFVGKVLKNNVFSLPLRVIIKMLEKYGYSKAI